MAWRKRAFRQEWCLASIKFHVLVKIKELLAKYFNAAVMRFTTKEYTTNWQSLEIGIMMGCVIPPLLFVMSMEMILRGAMGHSTGRRT